MVDTLEKQEAKSTLKVRKRYEKIEDKFCLLACFSEKFKPFIYVKIRKVYHLVLENIDKDGKYGIYSNGILAESMSYNWYNKGILQRE